MNGMKKVRIYRIFIGYWKIALNAERYRYFANFFTARLNSAGQPMEMNSSVSR